MSLILFFFLFFLRRNEKILMGIDAKLIHLVVSDFYRLKNPHPLKWLRTLSNEARLEYARQGRRES